MCFLRNYLRSFFIGWLCFKKLNLQIYEKKITKLVFFAGFGNFNGKLLIMSRIFLQHQNNVKKIWF